MAQRSANSRDKIGDCKSDDSAGAFLRTAGAANYDGTFLPRVHLRWILGKYVAY